MLNGKHIAVVLPAYNAEVTLKRTVDELDRDIVDTILLVDDASTDNTIDLAKSLGLEVIQHPEVRGYGGNQKSCYRAALDIGAEIIVMVHPDYQYSPLLVPAMAAMIAYGQYDFVLGSRILAQNSVAAGMPRYKYISNRVLTLTQNLLMRQKLSEYHTGLRAFSRELLLAVPYERNSDDFVFDNQIIAQAILAEARIGELSCPTRVRGGLLLDQLLVERSLRLGSAPHVGSVPPLEDRPPLLRLPRGLPDGQILGRLLDQLPRAYPRSPMDTTRRSAEEPAPGG